MAALPDPPVDSIIDLRDLSADALAPLLDEEVEDWRASLDWDFRISSELVRRFLQMRALSGFAVIRGGQVAGYSYFVAEEGKGLIGDFYVRPRERDPETEHRLLTAVLECMWRVPGMRRIEAQLMMLGTPLGGSAPYARWLRAFPRRFYQISLESAASLAGRECSGIMFSPWTENWLEEIARLIPAAYRGHVDSQINDQYRSVAGARRFLTNIVHFPGCGSFFAPASFIAWSPDSRELRGVSLASMVASNIGHVTQICVAPADRGKAVGYELLRRSLAAFASHGCHAASLTVTSSNSPAIALYERIGFRPRRDFCAYVWEIS